MQEVGNARGPKYLKWRFNPTGLDVPWGIMDYGLMPVCIAWANVTPAQNTTLLANNDVRLGLLNSNLDNTITAQQVQAVRDGLEFLDIPGQWVDVTDTWRVVLRTTCGLFQYAQRLHGKFNVKIVPDGYTLNTTWAQIPAQGKQFLLDTALELGIDTSGATAQTTLRQIYKAFADAWGDKPLMINGVTL